MKLVTISPYAIAIKESIALTIKYQIFVNNYLLVRSQQINISKRFKLINKVQ